MSTDSNSSAADHAVACAKPSYAEALGVWAKIGVLSFGGPAGQISLMHRMLVDEKKWLDEKSFLNALNFCMLLPGPEAMQLATYAGWRLHGLRGGLAAGLLFVIPGALVILGLSLAYGLWGSLPAMTALFVGIKAAVLAIVVEALLRISRRALHGTGDWIIAASAFLAIFAFAIPFPLIVLAALVIGLLRGGGSTSPHGATIAATPPRAVTALGSLGTAVIWLAIWLLPLMALAWAVPGLPVLSDIGWFFSKMAVVTFGGAYAVLAYVAQEGVQTYGWLAPGEMLDGLGLAETTPGPLILVNAYVGTLAGMRASSELSITMAIVGWAVTLWATFAPCFLWIFVGAPYVDRINDSPRLKGALATVTAAVVGVMLNLAVWFALNALFSKVTLHAFGPVQASLPDPSSLSPPALALSLVAVAMLFALHRSVITTLCVCGALALAWHAAV